MIRKTIDVCKDLEFDHRRPRRLESESLVLPFTIRQIIVKVMDTSRSGAALLKAWRKANGEISQRELAEKMADLRQPSIAQWETEGPNPVRPSLTRALELQALTKGEVPATSWGYTEEQVERVLAAAAFQPVREGIGHTSNDFAGPRDSIAGVGV